jgi:acid phosphatase type 7
MRGAKDVAGCEAGSPQEKWLRADLVAHLVACTLAHWHNPLFPLRQRTW